MADVGRGWALAAAGVVLVGVLVASTPLPSGGVVPLLPSVGAPAACLGALPSDGVTGELSVDGGPLPANATAGVGLTYTYSDGFRIVYASNGTSVDTGCSTFSGTATTEANGSFSFVPARPHDTCGTSPLGLLCTEYIVPQAPVKIGLSAGPPAGYGVSVDGTYPPITVTLVYQLTSVTISPGGPGLSTAVGDPVGFSASVWAANGSASLLDPALSWSVNGTGWSFDGAATGGTVRLLPVGAGVGTVAVRAALTVDGVVLPPVSATVDVVAIATEIDTGATNRTVVDVGGPIGFEFSASGAAGYTYTAFVQPGLGLLAAPAACAPGASQDGTVELECTATVSYPGTGTAQPTANITNGYSSAVWRFPDVTVAPAPAVEVSPGAPVGYSLVPVPILVSAANGSGASPYARACLASGDGPTACLDSPGPVWSFSPTYPGPGTFSASAWAIDADGANASISFPVTVVSPLGLGAVEVDGPNATAGAPVTLTANVSGGAVPLRYWWNASDSPGPLLDGELAADGAVNVTVVPNATGTIDLTLTVADRLGTVVAREFLLPVGPPAAMSVASLAPLPAGPVEVGTPVQLAWGAFAASGAPDRSFSAAVELVLNSSLGAPEAWVNASGAGPLASLGAGRYGVPATAWVEGTLTVSLTVATAAVTAVALEGSALPGPVPSTTLSVAPDLTDVRLSAPFVEEAGARTNATLWHVADRFGNPVPGALLTVGYTFGEFHADRLVAAIPLSGGGTGVWVNYSAPSDGAGEVTVTDGSGAVVLGPLFVPPAPASAAPIPTVDAVAAAVPLGVAGAAALVVVRRRRRDRDGPPAEEELARLAQGRARAVELIARAGAIDLAGLEAAWAPGPAPADLAEWLASLVADGTLGATVGADGRARFCLATAGSSPPRLTVDPDALERSLRRRDEELGTGPEDAADGPEPPPG